MIYGIIDWFSSLDIFVQIIVLLVATGVIWFSVSSLEAWIHRNKPDDFDQ